MSEKGVLGKALEIDIPPCPSEPRDLGQVPSPLRTSIFSSAQLGLPTVFALRSQKQYRAVQIGSHRKSSSTRTLTLNTNPLSSEETEGQAEERTWPISSSQVPQISVWDDSVLQVPFIWKLAS